MTQHQLARLVGIGAVIVAAVMLTAIGILFNLLVPAGSTVALLLAAIPLGCTVLAVLAGFDWMLEKSANWFESDSRRAAKLAKTFIRATNHSYPAARVNGAPVSRINSIGAVERTHIGA